MSKHIGSCFRIPQLHTQHEVTGECFRAAIINLTETNTVPCDFNVYNKTGLLVPDHPYMIQAGVAYGTPWIRDTSINIWNCARIIEPEISRNTLFAVCFPDRFSRPVIQEPDDNGFEQSWDKIIWAIGAWTYFLSTGDMPFIKTAFDIINRSLDDLRYYKLNIKFGLFTGGSFFNDGIAGYPRDLYDSSIASSFAPDHPRIRSIMCLSTNCIYCEAYRILHEMAIVFHDSSLSKSVLPGEAFSWLHHIVLLAQRRW